MAAAAFWFAMAAFFIAAGYFKVRGEALRHETLRRVIEKTGEVDQERLRELLQRPSPPDLTRSPWISPPGDTYKAFRVLGTLLLASAVGIVLFFVIVERGGALSAEEVSFGYAAAAVVAMVGLGFFLSSAFFDKPPKKSSERKDLL